MNRRLAITVLIIMLLGSLAFSLLGLWSTWEMTRQLASATETSGIVHSATVRCEMRRDEETDRTETYYVPEVHYAYEVDGKKYTSNRMFPGGITIREPREKSRRLADATVKSYRPGAETRVFYVPDDPATSFLKPVRRIGSGLFAVVGGMLAAAVTGILLPLVVPPVRIRFPLALILMGIAQALTWLIWSAFLSAPPEQLASSPYLLRWLLVAYVVICWTAFIAQGPPALRKLQEATLASVTFGAFMMSMSLFVLLPLQFALPSKDWLHAFPWVGVVTTIIGLALWASGILVVHSSSGWLRESEPVE